ncbi:ABC transporter substrate-binding protein [Terasakiella brassicae]|uniref:ABC transporter substrate-binding protein n=1 Tax=Terasakiella brassicae TaxID=1634917 RepID=A0A917C5R6_9PROT|nr:ABC transporter substrate-binding protein [Terasakiella brassicae]GGF73178.1 ABC transporter substrate-binding protein [Terasakiella brassicae]
MLYYIARFFCFFAMTFTFVKNAPASEVATVFTSYFPTVVIDNPQNPGLAYEIVAETFKLADKKFQIIHLPWARAQYMAKHTPQSLIFPFSWTPTRDKDYVWRVNIFNNRTHFITFNKTKLTAESARDKYIGVQLKSSWDNWLTEQGYQRVYRVPEDGSELIKLLRLNRVDAWYTDQIIADGALKKLNDPNITYSDPIQTFKTYLATSRAAPYPHMDELEVAFEKLRVSGKLDQLFDKYGITPNY